MPFTRDQVIDVKHIIKETIAELLADEEFKAAICEKVLQKLNIGDMQKKVSDLDKAYTELANVNKKLLNEVDNLRQDKKRKSLRIYGVIERREEKLKDEVLNIFNEKLKLNVAPENIKHCFRTGKNEHKKRAILVTFSQSEMKEEILKSRKLLKGTSITIHEDMTQTKHKLYKEVLQSFGKEKVWFYGGKINVKLGNMKHIVSVLEDIHRIKSL